MAVDAVLGIFT